MQRKKDTSHDEPYWAIVERAAEEMGWLRLVEAAGIGGHTPEKRRVTLMQWAYGRNNRKGERYHQPLEPEIRTKLLAFLNEKYPKEMEKIRRSEWKKIARHFPVDRRSRRQRFAEALSRLGCSRITSDEIRAGWGENQIVYDPDGGLTEEDLEYFDPLLDEEDREELARAVEEANRFREYEAARMAKRKSP